MADDIRISKKGAFRAKKLKPGEKTPHGNMPDIFKFERVHDPDGVQEPKIVIVNKEGNWKAEFKISQAPTQLLELLADRSKIYMICIPESAGLEPQSVIAGQDW